MSKHKENSTYKIDEGVKKEVIDFLENKPYNQSYPYWNIISNKDILNSEEFASLLKYISSYPLKDVVLLMSKLKNGFEEIKKLAPSNSNRD